MMWSICFPFRLSVANTSTLFIPLERILLSAREQASKSAPAEPQATKFRPHKLCTALLTLSLSLFLSLSRSLYVTPESYAAKCAGSA